MLSERFIQLLASFKRTKAPSVVAWLEQNIRLPREFTLEPGRFSIAGRPYMRSILECFHPDSGITDVVVSAGTQLMKTTILAMGMAYRIVFEPTSKLVTVPTKEFARDVMAAEKIHPLIEANAALRALKPAADDDFTKFRMAMLGGTITLVGANSTTGLGGRTVGMVLQDEAAKFQQLGSEQSPEGHPMELADERTKAYGHFGFRYKSSTPNVTTNPFWVKVEQGDQTEFRVPCQNPGCSERFALQWVNTEDSDYRSIVWSPDAKDKSGLWIESKVRETARFICPKCGYPHQEHERTRMIDAFEEVRTNPLASSSCRSFIVPSFYAPNIGFGDMALKFLKSKETIGGDQNFQNAWLALPYSQVSIKVGDEDVRRLILPSYSRGVVPIKPAYVLLTADPGQTTGVHWMVSAVSESEDIFVVDWGSAFSETQLPQLGARYKITRGLCDSRYNTDAVQQMCYQSGGVFWPTLGRDAPYGTYTILPIRAYPGLELIQFVDHALKKEVYGRRIKLHANEKYTGPRIHLPANADPMLLQQLSGQQFDSHTNRWKRLPHDHLGDCLKQVVLYGWVRRGVQASISKGQ